jgi:outer membrane protein assembly factor BamD (BamD/ComL family)
MKIVIKTVILIAALGLLSSCSYMKKFKDRAKVINNYEKTALNLAKENRQLKAEINHLSFQIQELKTKNTFLALQLEKKNEVRPSRGIASISETKAPIISSTKEDDADLVKFEVYQWTPKQLLATAEGDFEKGNYEKAAQFFHAFLEKYPRHELIDDAILFQSGISAYESGQHYDWVITSMTRLMAEYPASRHFRGAKLWIALTYLKKGEKKQFFNTVEEFRKKYRNTPEWKILSNHYEDIVQKYKS